MTDCAAIHWQVAQATSIHNVMVMATAINKNQIGICKSPRFVHFLLAVSIIVADLTTL